MRSLPGVLVLLTFIGQLGRAMPTYWGNPDRKGECGTVPDQAYDKHGEPMEDSETTVEFFLDYEKELPMCYNPGMLHNVKIKFPEDRAGWIEFSVGEITSRQWGSPTVMIPEVLCGNRRRNLGYNEEDELPIPKALHWHDWQAPNATTGETNVTIWMTSAAAKTANFMTWVYSLPACEDAAAPAPSPLAPLLGPALVEASDVSPEVAPIEAADVSPEVAPIEAFDASPEVAPIEASDVSPEAAPIEASDVSPEAEPGVAPAMSPTEPAMSDLAKTMVPEPAEAPAPKLTVNRALPEDETLGLEEASAPGVPAEGPADTPDDISLGPEVERGAEGPSAEGPGAPGPGEGNGGTARVSGIAAAGALLTALASALAL